MSDYYQYPSGPYAGSYPAGPYAAPQYAPYGYPAPNTSLAMGKVGAVVGVCGAGALNLHRLQRHEVTGGEAMVDTLRAGVVAGLAAASASYVASQFRTPTLSLLATLATGTAVAYALSGEGRKKPAGEKA